MRAKKSSRGQYLADKILGFLGSQGKTQSQLAGFAGISTGHVTDHINGRAYPKIETLIKYANFFGVTLYELTGNEMYRDIERRAAELTPTSEDMGLLNKFKSLPDNHWLRKAIEDVLSGKDETQKGEGSNE